MNSNKPQLRTVVNLPSTRRPAIFRGFVEGTAGLFDILGVRTTRQRRRALEDDARNLHRDLQRVSGDFQVVLSRIDAGFKK